MVVSGIVLIIPFLDQWTRVDMRAKAFSVPPQEVGTAELYAHVIRLALPVYGRPIGPPREI